MSRTVSTFFSRDVTGFSEPGKCPRCKRKVNVGGKGGTKAHKCPHGVWCNARSIDCAACLAPLLDAAKKVPREATPRRFTAAERATLDPLVVAALAALNEQVDAYDDYAAKRLQCEANPNPLPCVCAVARDRRALAIRSANAAGKALADALKTARGGK